jgi:hypothetical protein
LARSVSQQWNEFKAPTPIGAATAAVERMNDTANLALGAASESIDRLSGFFGRARDKAKVWRKDDAGDTDE